MRDLVLTIGGTPVPTPEGLKNLEGVGIQSIITLIINVLLVFAVIFTLLFLIWGGMDMIMAGGEKQRVVNARQKLTFAVIGLVVVFVSFLIVGTIGDLFGVKLLTPRP